MKCSYCGKDLPDTAKFCSGCGNPVSEIATNTIEANELQEISEIDECKGYTATAHEGMRKVCCPMCNGMDLQTVSETIGAAKKKYWLCSDCGHKFRNVQDWMAELDAKKGRVVAVFVLGVVMFLVGTFFRMEGDRGFSAMMTLLMAVGGCVFGVSLVDVIMLLTENSKCEELQKETTVKKSTN